MTTRAWLGLVIGLVAAGCGGGSGSSGGPVSLDQFPAAYAQAICDQNFKCASADDIMGRTKQDCLDTNLSGLQFLSPQLRASVQKGRLGYDAAQMGTCIASLRGMSCADWTSGLVEPAGCKDAFVPKVAVGGACTQDGECIGGTCDGADTSKMPPTDGMCVAETKIAHGAACGIADTCVDGDYCDGTCKTHKAGGEPCTSSDECGYSCNETTMKCSGYAGCAVGETTAGGAAAALMGLGLLAMVARRRRR
jgi:MYXO-CTERM domain-containing protein